MKKERVIKGWWFPHLQFVPATKKSIPIIRYEARGKAVELAGTPVRTGQVQRLSDTAEPIRCCVYGLHASRDIVDAAFYGSQYEIVCRVESWGDVDEYGDKLASRFRRIVRVYRLPKDVHEALINASSGNEEGEILLREIRRQDRARKAKAKR